MYSFEDYKQFEKISSDGAKLKSPGNKIKSTNKYNDTNIHHQ